ncbi:MAG TPA: GAF domain-containing protein [Stellaceae bacterium]|nr:GAF domain-containing protein [Stellaceae bacterium]
MTREPLTLADLAALADTSAGAPAADAVFRAVEGVAARVIGFRMLTIMRLHPASAEVERLYSSLPEAYPVSGRKPKQGTAWGAQVLDRGEVFLAATPEAVRESFTDYALLFSLGIGAILNVPIRFRGASLGTLNICHEAGWFRDEDFATGRIIASFLAAPLLAGT